MRLDTTTNSILSAQRGYWAVIALALACAQAHTISAQAEVGASSVADRLVRLTAHRFGTEPSCGVAFFADSMGLLLTTYQAIRGAQRLEVLSSGGRDLSDRTQVASYSTSADLAVLHTEGELLGSVPLGSRAAAGDMVSAWGYDDSMRARDSPVSISSSDGPLPHSLYTTDVRIRCRAGGPLIDRTGAAVGIVALQDAAIPISSARPLLAAARQSVVTRRLLTVAQVAGTENHLYGSALLEADVPESLVRVRPLESWHWPDLADEHRLPFTFSGPMGRYEVDFMTQGRVQSRSTFEIRPGVSIQVRLFPGAVAGGGGGKKLPWVLGVLGAAGAGTAVLIAGGAGGADGDPPAPTLPGAITVMFPKYIPRS